MTIISTKGEEIEAFFSTKSNDKSKIFSEYEEEEKDTSDEELNSAQSKKKKKNQGISFQTLNFSYEIYKGIQKIGFKNPTPIQRKALPHALAGKDCVIMSRTGSGKTAAFVLPLLQLLVNSFNEDDASLNNYGGVILSPTRELALQTYSVTKTLASHSKLKAITILGGESMEKQFGLLMNTNTTPVHVLIATPGRLAHHLQEISEFNLFNTKCFVLDEADRLFEMGLSDQIYAIYDKMNTSCQKILVSATMPHSILEFCKKIGVADDLQFIQLENVGVPTELRLGFLTCRSDDRTAVLFHLLEHVFDVAHKKTIIFAATRYHVEYITLLIKFYLNYNVEMVYGTLDQQARKESLQRFRKGKSCILVVTDVAARGMDIPELDYVIHYHFPSTSKLFIHRSGRVARGKGRLGYAIAILTLEEIPFLMDLFYILGRKVEINPDRKSYVLKEMTEHDVHFGSVPEKIISYYNTMITGSSTHHALSIEQQDIVACAKSCHNAMIQYRRSRALPSNHAVKQAKEYLKDYEHKTIPNHPLFCHEDEDEDEEDRQKRENFLQQMRLFRPKQTILEMTNVNLEEEKKNEGIMILMGKRRDFMNRHLEVENVQKQTEQEIIEEKVPKQQLILMETLPQKKRMSRAQRKRLKQGKSIATPPLQSNLTKKQKSYIDQENYISTSITTQQRQQKTQQSLLNTSETKQHAYLQLQQSIMEVVGDENADMVQKQRITRWDQNKRKYIRTTLGMEVEKIGMSSNKRMRLENGTQIKNKKLKVGELYEKWQKKQGGSNANSTSVFDHDDEHDGATLTHHLNQDVSSNLNNRNEIKTATQIQKERKKKSKVKIKNMSKDDKNKLRARKQREKDEIERKKNLPGRRKEDGVRRKGKLIRKL